MLAFRVGFFKNLHLHIEVPTGAITLAPAPAPSSIMCGIGGQNPVHASPRSSFPVLRSFPSLRSVHFAVQFDVLDFPSHGTPVPQVTSLRLAHLPSCKCHPHSYVSRRADGHLECCLAAMLSEGSPNLRKLHLDDPRYLETPRPLSLLRVRTPRRDVTGKWYEAS